jgi:hypothetical protein
MPNASAIIEIEDLHSASLNTQPTRRKTLARPHNHRPPSTRPSPLHLPPLHRLADPPLPALPLLPDLAPALPVHMSLRSLHLALGCAAQSGPQAGVGRSAENGLGA